MNAKKMIRKTMVALAVATAAVTATAETNVIVKGTKPHRTYANRAGGMVRRPGSARGKVVFLNAQKRVPRADMQRAFAFVERTIRPDMAVRDVASVSLSNPKSDIVASGGDAWCGGC